MLQLTKRTEYGLIALVHLADRNGDFVSVREICDQYPVPKRLLAEVLKELGRHNLLDSQRGSTGGYALSRPAQDITVGEVVAALEGVPSIAGCESLGAFSGTDCGVQPVCPIRSPMQEIRTKIWSLLQHTTIRDLVGSPHPLPR